ncbi:FHA domain-containing protein [Spirochaeta thermophila]|uniref:YscD cytoplasmic domain-containing protein n=1 Tax=Winmispira thermophila (strain ATCC 49972 / DSM 6192 / RI 19.B1) TaxID=665571 RepID=E0RRF5_WINT6|nr:FHA domain-containing protein [Spirochaeta thermophila]ADN01656.1 hypothetical protein STHERM_c06980 [Spirochaeta thermophila DSM 6192]
MSLMMKRLVMMLLGVVGGIVVWPLLLLVESLQTVFSSYLVFSLLEGMLFGLVFGAVFGSFEGIVVSSRRKGLLGLLWGAIFGLASGALGILVGQQVLFVVAEGVLSGWERGREAGLMFASGLGWGFIGLLVALTEGFRSRSLRKLGVGIAGGLVGGLVGGSALQAFKLSFPGSPWALLGGLVLFGLLLSFFYAFFENRFSWGALKVLTGPLKNKEYHLVKTKMSIGADPKCDIVLKGYGEVRPVHAWIMMRKGKVVVRREGDASLRVNDRTVEEAQLRREDVIAFGKAKLIYGIFV